MHSFCKSQICPTPRPPRPRPPHPPRSLLFKRVQTPQTDSTMPPPKPAIFFNERFIMRLIDTRKGTNETKVSICFLVCKDLSIDVVGVSRDTVFQEVRPGAGFETGDFVKEKLGERPYNDFPPKIEICQSNKHHQAADNTSLSR